MTVQDIESVTPQALTNPYLPQSGVRPTAQTRSLRSYAWIPAVAGVANPAVSSRAARPPVIDRRIGFAPSTSRKVSF